MSCLRNVCAACDSPQEFKKSLEIENFLVSCDWAECNEMTRLKGYLEHKSLCFNRQYRCPLKYCNKEVYSLQNLLTHFDSNSAVVSRDNYISCETNENIDCYWVVNGDLYHVVMKLDKKIIIVLFNEVDAISNNAFQCSGTDLYDEEIKISSFFAKCDINIANINDGYYKNVIIRSTGPQCPETRSE